MALSKLYRLPDKWIALYDNDTGNSWSSVLSEDIAVNVAKALRGRVFVDMVDGSDAIACVHGLLEEYLFWSADSGKKEVVNSQECICPDENFKFFGIGCICGAMKK